jgi:hypothetical protein
MDDAFICLDCSANTGRDGLDEYYVVHDEIWRQVAPSWGGMLCIGCLENRLGRKLHQCDFDPCPACFPGQPDGSDRLLDRLNSFCSSCPETFEGHCVKGPRTRLAR